jgi:hypothetical protein
VAASHFENSATVVVERRIPARAGNPRGTIKDRDHLLNLQQRRRAFVVRATISPRRRVEFDGHIVAGVRHRGRRAFSSGKEKPFRGPTRAGTLLGRRR